MKDRIAAIQRSLGVEDDGILGNITLTALEKRLAIHAKSRAGGAAPDLISLLLSLAAKEIGTKEEGTNTSKRVREYQAATNLDGTGWPWCAAFICWLFKEAGKSVSLPFKWPATAAAYGFEAWGRDNGLTVLKSPKSVKRGDIVVYSFSHVGIAETDSDSSGMFTAIEGNTNAAGEREGGAVLRKCRKGGLFGPL